MSLIIGPGGQRLWLRGPSASAAYGPFTPKDPTLKPTPETVGLTDEGALMASGGVSFTGGATYENLDITGGCAVTGNATVRNCRIDGNFALYTVNANAGGTNVVTFEDCEFYNSDSAFIIGNNVTIRRCVFRESHHDALKPYNNWVIEDSYVDHLGTEAGAHADVCQMVAGGNVTFTRCNLYIPVADEEFGYSGNATHTIVTNNGPIDDVVIDQCWLEGGNYTLDLTEHPNGLYGPPTGVVITDCRFGRDYRYGLRSDDGQEMVRSGNVWDDTGELIAGFNNA